MKDLTISAKVGGKDGETHEITVPFPETLDEAVEAYGEDVVFANFKANCVVGLQGNIRSRVEGKEPKTGKALQDTFADWKPGTRASGIGRVEKLKERIKKMSPEDKARLLEELNAGDDEEEAAKPAPRAKTPAAKQPAKPAAAAGRRR